MWVRSKYTSELAVLAAWVSLLVPWNVAYHTDTPFDGTVLFVQFSLFEIQFRNPNPAAIEIEGDPVSSAPVLDALYPGVELFGNVFATIPVTSIIEYEDTLLLQVASLFWAVAALAFALALVLSLGLYFRTQETLTLLRTQETLDWLPASEVRLMGALLGVAALGTGAASVLYYVERSIVGIPIPVGVVVIGVFALILLVMEEVPDDGTDEPA